MNIRIAVRRGLLASLLLLGGCGGLLGGGGKANLYRFGNAPVSAPTQESTPTAKPVIIAYSGSIFQRSSRGDRILTVTGAEVAYVAKARWIAPAVELFDTAMIRELQRVSPTLRIVRTNTVTPAEYLLFIDVQRFEAHYSGGSGVAPEVVVETRVRLVRRSDNSIVGEWPVTYREPAQQNRITAIISAFDNATASTTARIANLTMSALDVR